MAVEDLGTNETPSNHLSVRGNLNLKLGLAILNLLAFVLSIVSFFVYNHAKYKEF